MSVSLKKSDDSLWMTWSRNFNRAQRDARIARTVRVDLRVAPTYPGGSQAPLRANKPRSGELRRRGLTSIGGSNLQIHRFR